MDQLGIFHANQTSMCQACGWRRETGLSPQVNYFY